MYHRIYGDHHYLIALATSNLATAYMGKKDYVRAEAMFRDAVRRYSETQGPAHFNTAIARIKLGRALLRERRFADAQVETRAGYDILVKQANPAMSFLQNARKDLAAEYDSLGQHSTAERFLAELRDTSTKAATGVKSR
jgi:serine/threonine-protein kinase